MRNGAIVRGGNLTKENAQFYREQGYLIAEKILNLREIKEIRNESVAIFTGKRGIVDGVLSAEDGTSESDIMKKYSAIHFPHKISDIISRYIRHAKIVDVLTGIISPNVKCMQSMLFVKAPGKKGQAWHQDEFYIPTRDKSLTGVWIAIDDASLENGCLWIIPGSHKGGYIRKRVPYSGNEYADIDSCELGPYDENKDAVPVEVESGSVVFFNGYLLHSSRRNKSQINFRTALVNHYMSAESMLPWDMDGKIELKEDMRDIIMVAGKDPYAQKGVTSMSSSFVRPDKLEIVKD